jgi:hypothetical protein
MPKFFVGSIALVIAMLSIAAVAQTTGPNSQDQSVAPTTPNSGAGIPGHPGNKSGPPASKSGTTGSGVNSGSDASGGMQGQDASKIPGKTGSKSGPTARSPSSAK